MKYFKFVGKTKIEGWDENPKTNEVYSLKSLCKMYGKTVWNKNKRIKENEFLINIIGFCPEDWLQVPKPKKSLSEKIEKLKKQAEKQGMKCDVVLSSNPINVDIELDLSAFNKAMKKALKDIKILKDHNPTFSDTNPKDEWDWVEFAEYLYPSKHQPIHFKINEITDDKLFMADGSELFKDNCKPSTEQAYVDQLKAKVKELFGEIKEGDRFVEADGRDWELGKSFRDCGNLEWDYKKSEDTLFYYSLVIYQAGKWAKRVKERVRVELTHETLSNNPTYQFRLEKWNETNMARDSGKFLASQLESYLNGEIE